MKLLPSVLVLAAIGAGAAISTLRPEVNPAVRAAGLEANEQAAGASLLGQFRTSAASSLYARADLYLHGGVELRPMTTQERQSGKRGSDLKQGEQQVLGDESHLVTSIPSAQEDYRGIFGDLERATTAYKDMHGHTHNDAETTFPLFRLMTWIDPQFIDGWTFGAMLLTGRYTDADVNRAMNYLQEGLRANPESLEILTQIGILIATRKHDVETGLKWFENAHRLILEHKYGNNDLDAVRETYRWLVIAHDQQGHTSTVRSLIKEGVELFPDDQVLMRFAIKLKMNVPLPKSGS